MNNTQLMKGDIIMSLVDGTQKFERVMYIDVLKDEIILNNLYKEGFKSLERKSFKKIKHLLEAGLIDMSKEDPFDRSQELAQAGIKAEKIKIREDKKKDVLGIDSDISDIERISNKRIEDRNTRHEVIQIIAAPENEPQCFFEDRKKLVKEASEMSNMPIRNINRWLDRYWKSGNRLDSLMDKFTNMGVGPKVDKKNKVGRKSNIENATGIKTGLPLTDDVRRQFNLAIKMNYSKGERITLRDCWEWMINKFYADKVKKNNQGELKEAEYPSLEMFYKWHRQTDLEKQLKEKIGSKRYDKDYRGLHGDAMSEVVGPGHVVEIDATIADVWLRSSINPKEVVGRPVVYIAKDVYSRAIVGLHVSLEGPSYVGAMSLLYNMQANKVDYCKRYGIDIIDEEWCMKGMPQIIKADRGELLSPRIKVAIQKLGTIIDNTAAWRADAKGIVERVFRTINDKIIKFLPGHIKKDYRQRGARRYELDAELDIKDFTKIMILTVLDFNNSVLEGYHRTKEMIEDDIRACPNDIWMWGQKSVRRLRQAKSNEVIHAFMTTPRSASITERGILVDKLYYKTDMPGFEQLKARARREGRIAVNIRIDHRNIDKVYWIDKEKDRIITLYLDTNYEVGRVAQGHIWREVEMHLWTEHLNRTMQKSTEILKNKEFKDKSMKIVKESSKRNRGIKISLKNVKEARRNNSDVLRKQQAISKMDEPVSEITMGDVNYKRENIDITILSQNSSDNETLAQKMMRRREEKNKDE